MHVAVASGRRSHVNAPAWIAEIGGASVLVSAQDLLDLASVKLLEIAEPALLIPVRRIPVS